MIGWGRIKQGVKLTKAANGTYTQTAAPSAAPAGGEEAGTAGGAAEAGGVTAE